jgi:DNA-binding NarL/FixJ family response regulator
MNHKVRVLIVDDQQSAREGLQMVLTLSPQLEVVGLASSGQEAVELLAEHRPDVLVMDMQMPAMDGLQATKLIKKRWPAVKIIALTMYADYRSRALAAGADAFLLKGTPSQKLVHTILGLAKNEAKPE